MAVKDHQLFLLLKIFLQDGISEYRKWLETNEGVLSDFSMMVLHYPYCANVR